MWDKQLCKSLNVKCVQKNFWDKLLKQIQSPVFWLKKEKIKQNFCDLFFFATFAKIYQTV